MAIQNLQLRDEVHECLRSESVEIDSEQLQVSDLENFVTNLERRAPDMVLIDVSTLSSKLPDVISRLRSAAPTSMIVALNTSAATGPVLEAFRAGADEYLFTPLGDGLHKAFERRTTERTASEAARATGKVVAFLSAKGGCGATTLACHVSVELSRLGQKVLLADFATSGGMVSFLMKSKSPYSITDALDNVHRLDASYWKALVSNGIPNLEVISGSSTTAGKYDSKLDEIRQVLGFVRKQYQWTVADAGSGISYSSLTALECADQTCLVTTLEIPALHQTRQILQKVLDCGYSQDRLRLVVNRVPKRSGIRPEEIQEMLGVPVYAALSEGYSDLHEAFAQGQLLPPATELAQQMGRLGRKLAGAETKPAKRKLPFFG